MAYNNIHTNNIPWDCDTQPVGARQASADRLDNNFEICPSLELNQENISLFNQQQQHHIQYGSQYQNPYHEEECPPQQSVQPLGQSGGPGAYFNQGMANELFVADHDSSNYTRSDSSPVFVNPALSPETSETSAVYDSNNSGRLNATGFSAAPSVNTPNNQFNKKGGQKSKKQILDEKDAALIARDDSELTEEELQLKRKAQNRAAQRAFRERKETKLKELEAKLLQSEEERNKLMEELELIRKQNISISTENEILKSNNGHSDSRFAMNHEQHSKFDFPKTQDEFIHGIIEGTNHNLQEQNKNKVYNDTEGHKLLALGAVWDYLQIKTEEANLDFSSIDIAAIMDSLKGNEKCHGFGPAYPLDLVNQVVRAHLGV
ncbi:FCR3 [[Candida] subhashii]|uniref:FCR3 n=1 Tax=[Candida] subhashii TaxID=561895 RepID=A0A8J5QGC6_9ASCO|nr:FCR3 [[Candida] subhashii]KAG7661513.1 FCR3 [[Candida] subhashii]